MYMYPPSPVHPNTDTSTVEPRYNDMPRELDRYIETPDIAILP